LQDNGEENEDKIAIEKIKSERKKRSKKRRPQSDNEKADAESCCFGSEIGLIDDKLPRDGNIKSKKKKAVAQRLQENDGDAKTTKCNSKKMRPEDHKNIAQVGVRYV